MIENKMCHDITTDKFDFEIQTYQPKEYKSKMIVGNINIYQEKHFNKLQKIMWKIFFGVEIIDTNEKF